MSKIKNTHKLTVDVTFPQLDGYFQVLLPICFLKTLLLVMNACGKDAAAYSALFPAFTAVPPSCLLQFIS